MIKHWHGLLGKLKSLTLQTVRNHLGRALGSWLQVVRLLPQRESMRIFVTGNENNYQSVDSLRNVEIEVVKTMNKSETVDERIVG